MAKSTVKQRYELVQRSSSIRPPFEELDLNAPEITVVLGASVFHGTRNLIEIDGQVVLAIEPPEVGASFPTLSGFFADRNGNSIIKIEKNIWTGNSDAWDLEVEGREITIRLQKRDIALRLRVDPPRTIFVEALDMRIGSGHLRLTGDSLEVGRITPEAEYYVSLDKIECQGANIGVQVNSGMAPSPVLRGLTIIGGEGIDLVGTGVKVGVGAEVAHIKGSGIELATKQQTLTYRWDMLSNLEGTLEARPPRI